MASLGRSAGAPAPPLPPALHQPSEGRQRAATSRQPGSRALYRALDVTSRSGGHRRRKLWRSALHTGSGGSTHAGAAEETSQGNRRDSSGGPRDRANQGAVDLRLLPDPAGSGPRAPRWGFPPGCTVQRPAPDRERAGVPVASADRYPVVLSAAGAVPRRSAG
jgi:hypothetical protein